MLRPPDATSARCFPPRAHGRGVLSKPCAATQRPERHALEPMIAARRAPETFMARNVHGAQRSWRARAESGRSHHCGRGREEVPVARLLSAGAGRPGSPAQHLARIEPWMRVVFIWVRGRPGKRHEIRAVHSTRSRSSRLRMRPLSPAAQAATSSVRRRRDRDCQLVALLRFPHGHRRLCYRAKPEAFRNRLAKSAASHSSRSGPAPGPAHQAVLLIPLTNAIRCMRGELLDFVLATPRSSCRRLSRARRPAVRPPRSRPCPPRPPNPPPPPAPEFPAAYPPASDERRELRHSSPALGRCATRDGRPHGPFLVVEDEAIGWGGAKTPTSAGHLDKNIAGPPRLSLVRRTPDTFGLRIADRSVAYRSAPRMHFLSMRLIKITAADRRSSTAAVELPLETSGMYPNTRGGRQDSRAHAFACAKKNRASNSTSNPRVEIGAFP